MWYVWLLLIRFSITDALTQDMVPGLATEEFSTPPSSPVLATRTRNKAAVLTTESVDYKFTARDPSNDLQDNKFIQLGE